MSAIAGILNFNGEPVSIEQSTGMMKALEKFPANDIQTWHKDNLFLGCHAQWITPESIGEQLPFYDYERRLAITADAIIDNRDELFQLLQVDREDQKKITDSQLILLAYHKWGEESPKFLVGDFAYVIWDEKERKIFGARDASGYRTLYYYIDNSNFVFCSTIKPLFLLPGVAKQLNEKWLAEYLVIAGMIDTVDSQTTPYQNIYQFPPATRFSIVGKNMKLTKYIKFQFDQKVKRNSISEYVEEFQEIFNTAVKARLRTHRNIGAQLSGGLDSGAVVGFAGKQLKNKNKLLHTFSYIPPKDFKDFTPRNLLPDERPFIKSTVSYVGGIKDHYIDFEGKSSFSEIDEMLSVLEMPYKFFENSFWLKGMFEEAGKEDIGILLNGDRGNYSVSWGYALDYYSILLRKLNWFNLYKELDSYSRVVGGARLRLLPTIASISFPIINRVLTKEKKFIMPRMINPDFALSSGVIEKLKRYDIGKTGWLNASNVYEEREKIFQNLFPWNAGNTLTSKLSLRHLLWKRDPTNDIRVVRYCLSIPDEVYVSNGRDRNLIREATKGFLPEKVRLNQTVKGVQGVDWVHRLNNEWSTILEEFNQIGSNKRLLEYFDPQLIKDTYSHVKGNPRNELATNPYYKILMRTLILARFIEKEF